MKVKTIEEPRTFEVNNVKIKDYGKINLDSNEMITFVTKSLKEYDFTAKDWGFYITPSINDRLQKQGFDVAIVENTIGKIFIMAVEKEKKEIFHKYCINEKKKILQWLGNSHDKM